MSPKVSAPALVISGPTASGKTALSLRLAKDLKGEILSVDSVQVYRGADIGSAKLDPLQREGIPHHLIDIHDPSHEYNVAEFVPDAMVVLHRLAEKNTQAILAGGSTLYLTCLFHGLAELTPADPGLRASLEQLSPEVLHARLLEVDPISAGKIHANDTLRLIRALETYATKGRQQSRLHANHEFKESPVKGLFLVLCPERKALYSRINERCVEMLKLDLIEETKQLSEAYGPQISLLRSIGYAQVFQHLAGALTSEGLADEIAQHTRRFAKRQMTFWRNEPRKRGWKVCPSQDEDSPNTERKSSKNFERSFKTLSVTYPDLLAEVKSRLAQDFQVNEVWMLDAEMLATTSK